MPRACWWRGRGWASLRAWASIWINTVYIPRSYLQEQQGYRTEGTLPAPILSLRGIKMGAGERPVGAHFTKTITVSTGSSSQLYHRFPMKTLPCISEADARWVTRTSSNWQTNGYWLHNNSTNIYNLNWCSLSDRDQPRTPAIPPAHHHHQLLSVMPMNDHERRFHASWDDTGCIFQGVIWIGISLDLCSCNIHVDTFALSNPNTNHTLWNTTLTSHGYDIDAIFHPPPPLSKIQIRTPTLFN